MSPVSTAISVLDQIGADRVVRAIARGHYEAKQLRNARVGTSISSVSRDHRNSEIPRKHAENGNCLPIAPSRARVQAWVWIRSSVSRLAG
jgi:hypothetical protein